MGRRRLSLRSRVFSFSKLSSQHVGKGVLTCWERCTNVLVQQKEETKMSFFFSTGNFEGEIQRLTFFTSAETLISLRKILNAMRNDLPQLRRKLNAKRSDLSQLRRKLNDKRRDLSRLRRKLNYKRTDLNAQRSDLSLAKSCLFAPKAAFPREREG